MNFGFNRWFSTTQGNYSAMTIKNCPIYNFTAHPNVHLQIHPTCSCTSIKVTFIAVRRPHVHGVGGGGVSEVWSKTTLLYFLPFPNCAFSVFSINVHDRDIKPCKAATNSDSCLVMPLRQNFYAGRESLGVGVHCTSVILLPCPK